jgi:hypothetical protein
MPSSGARLKTSPSTFEKCQYSYNSETFARGAESGKLGAETRA